MVLAVLVELGNQGSVAVCGQELGLWNWAAATTLLPKYLKHLFWLCFLFNKCVSSDLPKSRYQDEVRQARNELEAVPVKQKREGGWRSQGEPSDSDPSLAPARQVWVGGHGLQSHERFSLKAKLPVRGGPRFTQSLAGDSLWKVWHLLDGGPRGLAARPPVSYASSWLGSPSAWFHSHQDKSYAYMGKKSDGTVRSLSPSLNVQLSGTASYTKPLISFLVFPSRNFSCSHKYICIHFKNLNEMILYTLFCILLAFP